MISKARHIQRAINRISAAFPDGEPSIEIAIAELRRAAKRSKLVASDRDDWGTPREVIAIVESLGKIALDAAAAKGNAKANKFYTTKGELRSWSSNGIAWCNPPFSMKLPFAKKYAEQSDKGVKCVLLLGGTESTAASKLAYDSSAGILRFAKRIKFKGATTGAPFDVRLYFSRAFPLTEMAKISVTEFDVVFTMEMRSLHTRRISE